MLSDDEKEVYKEYILDADKKAIVFDYERFVSAIKLMASKPKDLLTEYNEKLNIADEVALTFDNECAYVILHLKSEKCVSSKIYDLVMQIDKELTSLSNEHNEKNWTIEAMNNDERWISARAIANEVYRLLNVTK